MQTLWSRVAQASCRCPQCLAHSPLPGTVARRSTTAAARRPQYLTSSTLLYSGIFAAAATYDGKQKRQRREKWDLAIADMKHELGYDQDEQHLLHAQRQQQGEHYVEAEEQMLEHGAHNASDTETKVEKQTQSSLHTQFQQIFQGDDALRELEGNLDSSSGRPHRPLWPINTGAPLNPRDLPPQSIYAYDTRKHRADAVRWHISKLEKVMNRIDWLQLRILKQLHRVGSPSDIETAVPEDYARLIKSYTPELIGTAIKRKDQDYAALMAMTQEDRDKLYWEPFQRSEADIPLCNYHQDDLGHFRHDTRLMNHSLRNLFQRAQDGLISNTTLLANIAYNLHSSTAPPDIDTFNTLLVGFYNRKHWFMSDSTLHAMKGSHMRPNEVTLAITLNRHTATGNLEHFRHWVALMRGSAEPRGKWADHSEDGDGKVSRLGLMAARPTLEIGDKNKTRLVVDEATGQILQLPYPTPMVFGALIKGVLKFSGFENALRIAEGMAEEGWGLGSTGMGPLLRDCAERNDWLSGYSLWKQIQALQWRSEQLGNQGGIVERVGISAFVDMLRLCSKSREQRVYHEVVDQASRLYPNAVHMIIKQAMSPSEPGEQAPIPYSLDEEDGVTQDKTIENAAQGTADEAPQGRDMSSSDNVGTMTDHLATSAREKASSTASSGAEVANADAGSAEILAEIDNSRNSTEAYDNTVPKPGSTLFNSLSDSIGTVYAADEVDLEISHEPLRSVTFANGRIQPQGDTNEDADATLLEQIASTWPEKSPPVDIPDSPVVTHRELVQSPAVEVAPVETAFRSIGLDEEKLLPVESEHEMAVLARRSLKRDGSVTGDRTSVSRGENRDSAESPTLSANRIGGGPKATVTEGDSITPTRQGGAVTYVPFAPEAGSKGYMMASEPADADKAPEHAGTDTYKPLESDEDWDWDLAFYTNTNLDRAPDTSVDEEETSKHPVYPGCCYYAKPLRLELNRNNPHLNPYASLWQLPLNRQDLLTPDPHSGTNWPMDTAAEVEKTGGMVGSKHINTANDSSGDQTGEYAVQRPGHFPLIQKRLRLGGEDEVTADQDWQLAFYTNANPERAPNSSATEPASADDKSKLPSGPVTYTTKKLPLHNTTFKRLSFGAEEPGTADQASVSESDDIWQGTYSIDKQASLWNEPGKTHDTAVLEQSKAGGKHFDTHESGELETYGEMFGAFSMAEAPVSPSGSLGEENPTSASAEPQISGESLIRDEHRRGKPLEHSPDLSLLEDVPRWLRTMSLHQYTDNLKDMPWHELIRLKRSELAARGINLNWSQTKLLEAFKRAREAHEIDCARGPAVSRPLATDQNAAAEANGDTSATVEAPWETGPSRGSGLPDAAQREEFSIGRYARFREAALRKNLPILLRALNLSGYYVGLLKEIEWDEFLALDDKGLEVRGFGDEKIRRRLLSAFEVLRGGDMGSVEKAIRKDLARKKKMKASEEGSAKEVLVAARQGSEHSSETVTIDPRGLPKAVSATKMKMTKIAHGGPRIVKHIGQPVRRIRLE